MPAKQKPKPIPDDYRAATPYLCVKGAAKAIDFYVRAFGAKEHMRMQQPDGRIGHAEVRIGAAPIMLADEFPEMELRSPQSLGGSPVNIEDVDALVKRAVDAGATLTRPVADQFYGDRLGSLTDPFGHSWSFSTRIEDLSAEEIRRRAPKAKAAA
jgi:PhnB protein